MPFASLLLVGMLGVAGDDEFREFKGHTGPTRVALFTPDGKTLVTSSGWPEGDQTARVWDVKTGKVLRVLKGHTGNIDYMTLSDDGKKAYTASHDHTVRGWDVETGKELVKFTGHGESGVGSVAVSPDGKTVASGDGQGKLYLWDAATGKKIREFVGHEKDVRCLVFLPDGKKLVSGSWDGTVMIWNVETGKEFKTLRPDVERVENFALFDKGKKLLVAGDEITLYDLEKGEAIRTYPGHPGTIAIGVSPDGKRMMTGTYSGQMNLWNVSTGERLAEYQAHHGHVNWCSFSPDGKWVASAGGGNLIDNKGVKGTDFTIRLWKLDELP